MIAHEPIEYIYFPEDGIASIVSELPHSGKTEVGIFGRDGFSGVSVLLGSDITPHETFMQVDGTSVMRIGTSQFKKAVVKMQNYKLFCCDTFNHFWCKLRKV